MRVSVAVSLDRTAITGSPRGATFEKPTGPCLLAVNGGSSSLKFALFAALHPPVRLLRGRVERIGMPVSRMIVAAADGPPEVDREVEAPDQPAAIRVLMEILKDRVGLADIAVVGHLFDHNGKKFYSPVRIAGEVQNELRLSG